MPKTVKKASNTFPVPFEQSLTIGHVEDRLAKYYARSLTHRRVAFDLRAVEFMGHFPATIFYSWCEALIKQGSKVTVMLPPVDDLNNQLNKVYLQCGLLYLLKSLGVEVPYAFTVHMSAGVPMQVISTRDNLWTLIERLSSDLAVVGHLSDTSAQVIRDAMDVVLFELADNSFVHTDSKCPHFQLTVSDSEVDVAERKGLVSTFPYGTKYIEICLGDLGPGIDTTLEQRLPPGYTPSLVPKDAPVELKTLSFAFDFSSTSDKEGRKARIQELLNREELDPDDVATGLFCVLEVVRARHGQLIVRTPNTLLSIDFTQGKTLPLVKSHKNIGIKSLAPLMGSHIVVRMPLSEQATKRTAQRSRPLNGRATFVSQVSVVSPFRGLHSSESPAEVLHQASAIVDAHFNHLRHLPGLSIFMPGPSLFPSRGLAAFLGMLRSIPHGKRTVFWLDSRLRTLVPDSGFGSRPKKRRFRFGGQPVLIGDLVTNELFLPFNAKLTDESGLTSLGESPNDRAFKPGVFAIVQKKYGEELTRVLEKVIQSDTVRHEPGPFLIEGKYYTEIFYEVPRVTEDTSHVLLVADWCLRQIVRLSNGDTPSLLIGTCKAMGPVLQHLSDLLKRATGRCAKVICRESAANELWGMSALLPFHGERAVIVTDVVCRGRNISDFLLLTGGISVIGVLAFVDGHENRRQRIIVTDDKPYSIPFTSIVYEHIIPHHEPPSVPKLASGEERIYVIDRTTQAPTLYLRHSKPTISICDQLETTVLQSRSLYCGHSEFAGRHYTYYLDLVRLFSANRGVIEKWIDEQLSVPTKTVSPHDSWKVRALNPDGSLDWLPQYFDNQAQKVEFAFVRKEHLDAPPPFSLDHQEHWVLIIPAIANGETARRGIEYLSRHKPKSMLLLCVLSRADPQDLDFMLQIGSYGDSPFRMGVLFEFPVLAYLPGPDSCPLCAEVEYLEQQLTLIRQSGGSVRLQQAFTDKIKALSVMQHQPLVNREAPLPALSDGDIARAKLLSLYDASQFSVDARKHLSSLLLSSEKQLDWFLEMLSQNRRNSRFNMLELQRRLYKTYERLLERVRGILVNEQPPFQLGRAVNGICLLAPGLFLEKATDILIRYKGSIRDLEDICMGLIALQATPANIGKVLQTLRETQEQNAEGIISDTIHYLRNIETPDKAKAEEQIRSVCHLCAQLLRTSLFSTALTDLINHASNPHITFEKLSSAGHQVVGHWRQDVLPLMSAVQTGGLWDALASNQDDAPLTFEPIERNASQLAELIKYTSIRNPAGFRRRVEDLSKMIQKYAEDVAYRIFGYFVNLVNCSAAQLPRTLPAHSGATIYIETKVDRTIGRAFCNLNDLDAVTTELIINWQKNAKNATRQEAVFSLSQGDGYIVLEFADNFGGEFDLSSWGGINTAKVFCRRYCGEFETTEPDENGIKAIRLKLRKFVKPKWIDLTEIESYEKATVENIIN